MQKKHIPMRMCIGCREKKSKKEMIRVVRSSEGQISLDATGKKSGRGAYVCKDTACFQKMRKSRNLERTFSCKIDPAVYDQLEKELGGHE